MKYNRRPRPSHMHRPSAQPPSPASLGIDTVRRSSGDDAAMYIRRLMFEGELLPGSRVPQDDISAALGISRIPVREALIALEREGSIRIEPHRGAFINALDAQSVRDHYELYGIVYGFAARRALQRTSSLELVEQLPALVDDLGSVADPTEFTRTALAFHRAILDAAGSARIKVVIRAMSGVVPGDFFSLIPSAMHVERRSLPLILKAVNAGDADQAAGEYLDMMRAVGEEVIAVLAGRGLFEATEPPPLPKTNGRTRRATARARAKR
jgi:DNA-binding GntR family transcriptional regulator